MLCTGGQRERHVDHKPAVSLGGQFALGYGGVVITKAHIALLPIIRIGEPPVGHAALHGVFHLRTLHAYAGVRAGLTRDGQRVASLIAGLHLVEQHLVSGTLVLFHAEHLARLVSLNDEAAVQLSRRQDELCRSLTVLVGNDGLLLYDFIVGIAQAQGERAAFHAVGFHEVFGLVDKCCHIDRLSRAVDATVGIEVDGLVFAVAGMIVEPAVLPDG